VEEDVEKAKPNQEGVIGWAFSSLTKKIYGDGSNTSNTMV
jgi:hypothetical protein